MEGGKRSGTGEMLRWYLVSLTAASGGAVAAGFAVAQLLRSTRVLCERVVVDTRNVLWLCPDGVAYAIPALASAGAAASVVLAGLAFVIGGRVSESIVRRMSVHVMWLVLVVVVVAVGLAVSAPSADPLYLLLSPLVVLAAALPVVLSKFRRDAVPAVLAVLLAGLAVILLLTWQQMLLLVPIMVLVLGGWALALILQLRVNTRACDGSSLPVRHQAEGEQ